MAKSTAVRVLLVDDHMMLRESLRVALHAYPSMEVVGEAGNGEEALSKVDTLKPNVVVMDVNMPKMGGIAATREIKRRYPGVAVLGLSMNACRTYQAAMQEAGAVELFPKERAVRELYAAIQKAADSVHDTAMFAPDQAIGLHRTAPLI
ncbi:MAG TPA: response regulator transcription factor [Nitrospira sp.]|nr:response regulator transcription factor [Nitrospira sp.]